MRGEYVELSMGNPKHWLKPETVFGYDWVSAKDDLSLMTLISDGCKARGDEPVITFGRTKADLVLTVRLTPNSVLELGIGPGRPIGYRYKSGEHTDADKYFSEYVIEFFDSFRHMMSQQANVEGKTDSYRRIAHVPLLWAKRWRGTEWEKNYEEGLSVRDV